MTKPAGLFPVSKRNRRFVSLGPMQTHPMPPPACNVFLAFRQTSPPEKTCCVSPSTRQPATWKSLCRVHIRANCPRIRQPRREPATAANKLRYSQKTGFTPAPLILQTISYTLSHGNATILFIYCMDSYFCPCIFSEPLVQCLIGIFGVGSDFL